MDSARGNVEDGVGVLDALVSDLDDPNGDGDNSDSFTTQHLEPMLGIPSQITQLAPLLQGYAQTIDDNIIGPLGLALNPISQALGQLNVVPRQFAQDIIQDRYGLSADQLTMLSSLPDKMDVQSVTIGSQTISVFQPGDHAKLDAYLGVHGVALSDSAKAALQNIPGVTYFGTASVDLGPDVEFDPTKFAAYADAVQLSKIALLSETPVGGAATGDHQLSLLVNNTLTDLGTPPAAPYDWSLLNVNGDNGGNVLTTTLQVPGVVGPWLVSSEGDHNWQDLNGQTGGGNFPLWQSATLRPVFRTLFLDWQDGAVNFPDLGDAPATDPNSVPGGITPTSTIPPLVTPFVPPPIVAPPAGMSIIVSGDLELDFTTDVVITSITGDGAGPESLILNDPGHQVRFVGPVGGLGLLNLTVTAGNITVDPNVVISTRQVAGGADPRTAPSVAASGSVSFTAPEILVGAGAAILAGATGGFAAGNVTFTATQATDLSWSYGIDGATFRGAAANTSIDVGAGALITGHDVTLTGQATTHKSAVVAGDLDPMMPSGLGQQITEADPITVNSFAAAVFASANANIAVRAGRSCWPTRT